MLKEDVRRFLETVRRPGCVFGLNSLHLLEANKEAAGLLNLPAAIPTESAPGPTFEALFIPEDWPAMREVLVRHLHQAALYRAHFLGPWGIQTCGNGVIRPQLHASRVRYGERDGLLVLFTLYAKKTQESGPSLPTEHHQRLFMKSERAREEERLVVARDLHDGMGQALTVMRFHVKELEREINRSRPGSPVRRMEERIQRLYQDLDTLRDEMRRIVGDLRPALLDLFGVSAAIEHYAGELGKAAGWEMEFKSSGRDAGLDKDLQTAIFRIAQEALTNAARHADAKRVTIKLEVASSHVEMIVADHGKGMGSMRAPQAGSLGLIGMQQRAHMWGGVINIVSTPRVGTTVRLKIPLIPAGPDVGDPAHV